MSKLLIFNKIKNSWPELQIPISTKNYLSIINSQENLCLQHMILIFIVLTSKFSSAIALKDL